LCRLFLGTIIEAFLKSYVTKTALIEQFNLALRVELVFKLNKPPKPVLEASLERYIEELLLAKKQNMHKHTCSTGMS